MEKRNQYILIIRWVCLTTRTRCSRQIVLAIIATRRGDMRRKTEDVMANPFAPAVAPAGLAAILNS
jgi:hypothetical protein